MKILTVIFLVYYIVKVFKQRGWLQNSMVKMCEMLPQNVKASEAEKCTDKLSKDELTNIGKETCKLFGILVLYIIFILTEFIYVIKATSMNCNKVVVVGYLIFWILILIKGMIQNKRNKVKKDITIVEGVIKLKKYKISQMLINLVDVAYFGYMFFVLFIK